MKAIRFLRPCPPYNPGEVAGFDEKVADHFIARGTAEAAKTEQKAETSPPVDKMQRPARTKSP